MTPTICQTLTQATKRLSSPHQTPRLEAEILLAHSLSLPRSYLYSRPEQTLVPSQIQRFQSLLEQRVLGHPIAYLIGMRAFWSMELKVSQDTLIPRPETERLVEVALDLLPEQARHKVADLGTGCGAIALAIAKERPNCHIIATDQSLEALQIAADNARRLGLGNIEFRDGDWCAALGSASFDLVVSNPPYVAIGDPHLTQGDLRFEPNMALQSGIDGLEAIRTLIRQVPYHLKKEAFLLLEHAYNQAPPIHNLLAQSGLTARVTYHDHNGQPRISAGKKVV